jgi:hypothetical protein
VWLGLVETTRRLLLRTTSPDQRVNVIDSLQDRNVLFWTMSTKASNSAVNLAHISIFVAYRLFLHTINTAIGGGNLGMGAAR